MYHQPLSSAGGRGFLLPANAMKKQAFTLIELLVVLGIIALLCAILLPVLFQARKKPEASTCLSNLRQMGAAISMYVQDNDGYFPGSVATATPASVPINTKIFYHTLMPYMKTKLKCPASYKADAIPIEINSGYCINYDTSRIEFVDELFLYIGISESEIRNLSNLVLFSECRTGYIAILNPDGGAGFGGVAFRSLVDEFAPYQHLASERHSGGSNYLIGDGHAKWHQKTEALRRLDGSITFRIER
jgi:prepilin-type N-terminal cleavage/methylation domain-containing protein/prepilin-type processing-associated H-X9-DG protein